MDNEAIEINLLLEAIYQKYGYDFKEYADASMRRKILHRLELFKLSNISEMTHRVLHEQEFFEILLQDFYTSVTEMFRDPSYYQALRKAVIPILKTYSHPRIWVAGCASGEEAYSLAILLKEEGLYDRSQIYATDLDKNAIKKARDGLYSAELLRKYTSNYQKAGGVESFSDYYVAQNQNAVMDPSLKQKILFSTHNLVSDDSFNEMHLISCRNVLIYFKKALQERVLGLFHRSLCRQGILCLGAKESLHFTSHDDAFETLMNHEKIYRKK